MLSKEIINCNKLKSEALYILGIYYSDSKKEKSHACLLESRSLGNIEAEAFLKNYEK